MARRSARIGRALLCSLALGSIAPVAACDWEGIGVIDDGVARAPDGQAGDPGGEDDGLDVSALTIEEGLDAEEIAFVDRLNDYRAQNGLAPLQVSIALTRAADAHSSDMAARDYFAHDTLGGPLWYQRIQSYYPYDTYLGENIAAGNSDALDTFEQWRNSPGHDANMRSTSYRVIGIARAYGAGSTYGWYWTNDFGGYVDEVYTDDPPPPPPPPPPPSNLLANPGFETNDLVGGVVYTSVRSPGRWYWGTRSGTAAITSLAAAEGGLGLRIYDHLVGSISASQLIAGTVGKTYTASIKTRRASGPNSQAFYLDFLDASFTRIGRASLSTGTSTTWHTISLRGLAPAGTAWVRVVLYGLAGNNDRTCTFDWDAASITAQ